MQRAAPMPIRAEITPTVVEVAAMPVGRRAAMRRHAAQRHLDDTANRNTMNAMYSISPGMMSANQAPIRNRRTPPAP